MYSKYPRCPKHESNNREAWESVPPVMRLQVQATSLAMSKLNYPIEVTCKTAARALRVTFHIHCDLHVGTLYLQTYM